MPALAVLVGWLLVLAGTDAGLKRLCGLLFTLTGTLICACAIAIIAIAYIARQSIQSTDVALAAGAVLAGASAILLYRIRSVASGVIVLAAGTGALLVALHAWWLPSVSDRALRTAARELRDRFGERRYCTFGDFSRATLSWELRQAIPQFLDADALISFASDDPSIIVLVEEEPEHRVPVLPAGFVRCDPPIHGDGNTYYIYVPRTARPATTSPASRARPP
jgi:hypothetical protein